MVKGLSEFWAQHIARNSIKRQIHKQRGGTLDKILHIDTAHKLVFVPVPKAANTSIIRIIWNANNVGGEVSGQKIHDAIVSKNPPLKVLSKYSNQALDNIFCDEQWLRITFVRNPYTRLISSYRDKILNTKRNKNFLTRMGWHGEGLPSFDEFIAHIVTQDVYKMDWHWRPQYNLVMPELTNINYVGKIENFNQDILPVLQRLGLNTAKQIEQAMVKENKSTKSSIAVSEATIKLIQEKYRQDFDYFNYDTNFCDQAVSPT